MEKYSFEKAQDEAVKMKAKVESGVAENYSEAEILEQIEKTKDELKLISKTFDIDTEKFSDDSDMQFAENESQKYELLQKYCEAKGINFKQQYSTRYSFLIDESRRKQPHDKRAEISCNFLEYTFSVQFDEIKKHGKITSCSHENIFETIKMFDQIFLPEERKAIEKLQELRQDIKSRLQSALAFNELKSRAKNNDVLGRFINHLSSKKLQIKDSYDISNEIYFIQQSNKSNEWSDEDLNILNETVKEIGADTKQKVADLNSLHGRVLAQMARIFNQRAAYLLEQAENKNPDLFLDTEKSGKNGSYFYTYVNVAPQYNITAEDAKKAEELNLPWSKYEKELAK